MNRNFKIGDKVLVRMKISDKSEGLFAESSGGMRGYIEDYEIFAHAPEYNIGEELEFSHDGESWNKEILTGFNWNNQNYKRLIGEKFFYNYARRPQPKPKAEEKNIMLDGKKYKLVPIEE